jgi:hypothetical protein
MSNGILIMGLLKWEAVDAGLGRCPVDLRGCASCILAERGHLLDVTAEDFTRHYESLSDEALLELDPEELTAVARACLAHELTRRGLDSGEGNDEDTAEPAAATAAEEEEQLVCIVEYDYPDEADLARGLLEAAEIPAKIESEPGVVRLMVPERFSKEALTMLVAPLSDEELAAQAEAAANPDEDFTEPRP